MKRDVKIIRRRPVSRRSCRVEGRHNTAYRISRPCFLSTLRVAPRAQTDSTSRQNLREWFGCRTCMALEDHVVRPLGNIWINRQLSVMTPRGEQAPHRER